MSLAPTPELQDCWNRVGVQGDASCPRLAEVSHCRNCPVYSSAAARLLHGEPPEEYLAEWTGRLARGHQPVDTGRSPAVLIFRLGAEWLALPAAVFQEVAEPRPIHSLPHRRGKILKGLVNIRGELVLCISLGGTLGIDELSEGAESNCRASGPLAERARPRGPLPYNLDSGGKSTVYERLLVVGTPGGRLAFPVAEVHGIETFAPAQWRPVPETLALASARYTGGVLSWQGRTVGCLDDQPLFAALNRSLG